MTLPFVSLGNRSLHHTPFANRSVEVYSSDGASQPDADEVAAIVAVLEAHVGATAGTLQRDISRWRNAGRRYTSYDDIASRRRRRAP